MRLAMPRFRFAQLCLALTLSALLPAQQAGRIATPPVAGHPGASGWQVDPGRGQLSLSIPIGTVTGEVPIPVAFTMNGSFMSYCLEHHGNPSDPDSTWQDFGVHGTLGFGYIGWSWQGEGAGNRMLVLEDGRSLSASEFESYTSPSPYARYGTALAPAFGIASLPVKPKISTDGSLAWVSLPAAALNASFAPVVTSHLPSGYGPVSNYDIVMDKERIRVFAEVEAVCPPYLSACYPGKHPDAHVSLPVYWADRFGHWVTFQWTLNASGLPPGVASLVRVDALNQRNQGVTVRYANWNDNTDLHDLLRADFVGFAGPSVLMRGYSGTAISHPVGFSYSELWGNRRTNLPLLPYTGGLMARPTTITVGEAGDLDQPSWSHAGSSVAEAPPLGASSTGTVSRVWSLGYDGNLAALTSLTSPALVETRFVEQRRYMVFEAADLWPMMLWGVDRVQETDLSGRGSATHAMTWKRHLPCAIWGRWALPTWTATCEDGWNQGDDAQPDRTSTFTYASPTASLLDYRNMFLQSCTVTDGTSALTTTTKSGTRADRGGGLDGSLSLPQSVTTTGSGERDRRTSYLYSDPTGLQVLNRTDQFGVAGTYRYAQIQDFRYDDRWGMLEGHQDTQVRITRFPPIHGISDTYITTKTWDQGTRLQLRRTSLEAYNCRHGQAFTYNGEGKLASQSVDHVENGAILASPANLSVQYDPGTGQPAVWTTAYQEVPAGTRSTTKSAGGFDGADRPTVMTDDKGVQTTLAYDLFGRVIRTATQGLAPVTTAYPDPWTMVRTQDGRVTTTHLDGFGRPIAEECPDWTQITYAYDGHGRLAATTKNSRAGTHVTRTTQYDFLDRPVSQTDFDGTTTTLAYAAVEGGCNQVTRSFNGACPTRIMTDPFGQDVQVTAPSGDVTRKTYDVMGNVIKVETIAAKDGQRQTRTFFYDPLGRLIRKIEPETGTTAYGGFNALNLPTRIVEVGSSSRSRTLAYDGLGRRRELSAATPDGRSATERFSYAGALLTDATRTASGDTGSVEQHFDYFPPDQGGFLRMETTTQEGLTSAIGYTYTNRGAIGSIRYPSGRTVSYGFDGLGRVISVAASGNGSTRNVVPMPPACPFDEWGNRGSLVFQSGAMDVWHPDATLARPGRWDLLPPGGSPISWTYAYEEGTGRLTGTGEWSLKNDGLGRLVKATQNWSLAQDAQGQALASPANLLDNTLEHDAFGNNVRSTALAAGLLPPAMNNFTHSNPRMNNQLPPVTSGGSSGVIAAAYDPWGELQSVATGVSSDQYLDLAWDPLGRLARVSQSRTGAIQTYRYAPSGLRVASLDRLNPDQNRYYAYAGDGRLLTAFSPSRTAPGLQGVRATGLSSGSGTSTHSGHQALRIWHRNGNNSSMSHYLGEFPAGDTLTATAWVNAPVGTQGVLLLGNVFGSEPVADNVVGQQVPGTGAWQQVTVTRVLTRPARMWIFLYGNGNQISRNGTFTLVDDVSVTSAMNPSRNFQDGFEKGLELTSNGFDGATGWYSSGSDHDVVTASTATTFSGQGALKIMHQEGTNRSLAHDLGRFPAGDTLTATVWVNSPPGTTGKVYLGDPGGQNAESQEVAGTGTWQLVTVSHTMAGNAEPQAMELVLYGNSNGTAPGGTYSCWDEVAVADSSSGMLFRDGFESGLTPGSAWTTAGQPDVHLLNLAATDVVYLDGRAIAEIDDQGVHELHNDHLGTPRVITAGSSGAVEGIQTYGPYGEGIGAWGYVPLTGYTGHVQTEANGLIYMKGRYFSPAWHSFLNTDQGADSRQMNQYAYAGGNPMTNVDPTGMWSLRSVLGDIAHGTHSLGHAMGVNWNHGLRRDVEVGGALAASWFLTPYISNLADGGVWGGILGGASGGALSGGAIGGNVKSAFRGAIIGGFIGGVVGYFQMPQTSPAPKISATGADADPVGTLTISANGEGGGLCGSGGLSGHSWLTYTSNDGTVVTYGTYGNNPCGLGNGLHVDLEINIAAQASRTVVINGAQLSMLHTQLLDFVQMGQRAWGDFYPCSTFSSHIWNVVTGETLSPYGPYSNPSSLKNAILAFGDK
jgi:RHS repeat-associated protein